MGLTTYLTYFIGSQTVADGTVAIAVAPGTTETRLGVLPVDPLGTPVP